MRDIKSNADLDPCLCVVMPVFNEAATVAEIVQSVLAQRPVPVSGIIQRIVPIIQLKFRSA